MGKTEIKNKKKKTKNAWKIPDSDRQAYTTEQTNRQIMRAKIIQV